MNMIKSIFLIIGINLIFICGCKNENGNEIVTETSDIIAKSTFDLWKALDYKERQGKQLFDKYCVVCHGKEGRGDGFNSYSLNPKPQNLQDSLYINKVSNIFLNRVISSGGRGFNMSSQMPAYKSSLDEFEIESIVSYIRKLNSIPL